MSLLSDLASLEQHHRLPANSLRRRFFTALLSATRIPTTSSPPLPQPQQLSVGATFAAILLQPHLDSSASLTSDASHKRIKAIVAQLDRQEIWQKDTVHAVARVLLQLQKPAASESCAGTTAPALSLNPFLQSSDYLRLPQLEPLVATATAHDSAKSGINEDLDLDLELDLDGREGKCGEATARCGFCDLVLEKETVEVEVEADAVYTWEYTASMQLSVENDRVRVRRPCGAERDACAASFDKEYLLVSERGQEWYEDNALRQRDDERMVVVTVLQALRQLKYALLGIPSVLFAEDGTVNERLRLKGVGYATSQAVLSRMCAIATLQRRIKAACTRAEDFYSVRGMFDCQIRRLLDEHAFALINSLADHERSLLEMTAHIDCSVQMLSKLELLCTDIEELSQRKEDQDGSSLDILQLLFLTAERSQPGSHHHDVVITLLKVCSRKLEAILESLLLLGENPVAHDRNCEFVKCPANEAVEAVDVSRLYEDYAREGVIERTRVLPLTLKLPAYMRSRTMNWDAHMLAWRITTCAYSLQMLRKCSPPLYRVCTTESRLSRKLSLIQGCEAQLHRSTNAFSRLREASEVIVRNGVRERAERVLAAKQRHAAMVQKNAKRLSKFYESEQDEAERLKVSKQEQLAFFKAQAEEAMAKKKQARADRIEAERKELREKQLQDEAVYQEAARWLQDKYKDADVSYLNLSSPSKPKQKWREDQVASQEQEKENTADSVLENGASPAIHRPQISVLQPPGGESSIHLGSWKPSPTAKSLSKLMPIASEVSSTPELTVRAPPSKIAQRTDQVGEEEARDAKLDSPLPQTAATLEQPESGFNFKTIAGSRRRKEQALMSQLFDLQKVKVFTSSAQQRSIGKEHYVPPISYTLESGVVLPILQHCRLIDAAAVEMFLSQLHYLQALSCVKDYLLLARGDLFHGFLKHILESPDVNWRNQALLRSAWQHEKRISGQDEAPDAPATFALCVSLQPGGPSRYDNLEGLDFIEPELKVDWPLNALLSSAEMEGLYGIHRYLFRLRRTLMVYESVWLGMKKGVSNVANILKWHEIRHFLSNYHSYVNSHILGELWPELVSKTKLCKTSPRDLKRYLKAFIGKAQRTCFLDKASKTLAELMQKLFETVYEIFHEYTDTTTNRHADKCWTRFDRTRKFLMRALKSHSCSSPEASASKHLLMRLNYNNFYEQRL